MNAFWRKEPLEKSEMQLLGEVLAAHYLSTFRDNPSTVAVQCAARGNGRLTNSIAAGLLTLGGPHGPIEETYDVLVSEEEPKHLVGRILGSGHKVPGWGSSFNSGGQTDPAWAEVDRVLLEHFEERRWRMTQITQALHENGKLVLPNPSAYTALAAIILKMPRRVAPLLVLLGRAEAWSEIFFNETKGN